MIEDILQDCQGCSVFSVTMPFGIFEFLVMPLGLCNATQTFQRFLDNLLRDLPFA